MRTNAEYRKHMTHHAASIMQDNLQYACDNLNARAFDAPLQDVRAGEPHHFTPRDTPVFAPLPNGGLFGYETNATKDAFLAQYAREAFMVRRESANGV